MIAWLDRVLPLWRVMLFGMAAEKRRKIGSCTGFENKDGVIVPIEPKWESEE